MAVGKGSMARASKAAAKKADSKTAVVANVDEAVVEAVTAETKEETVKENAASEIKEDEAAETVTAETKEGVNVKTKKAAPKKATGKKSATKKAEETQADVVVFDKPVNMPVHPSIKHQGDTLGNCFSAMYPQLTFRPVNRLDKDTSGLCAVAKNPHAANVLQGTLKKVYYAVVCGEIASGGRIDAPIGRAGESIIRREVREDGQRAVTDYTIIKGNRKYTLLRVILLTGRTHQIRVHFSHTGHPLAGDDFYGGSTADTAYQALHCGELEFVSPVSKEIVRVSSPIRNDMEQLVVTEM